jgi:hypothetical protein
MKAEDAHRSLQQFLEYNERGIFTMGEACLRLYELAAFIEPQELLAAIPESLRCELQKDAKRPLIPREEWSTIIGGTVVGDIESYRRNREAQEDRQYAGLSRLHGYFSEHE